MTGRYKAYPEYKNSGVEWLKEIPIHWDCKKLKFFLNDLVRGPFGSALKKEFFTTAGIKVYEQKNCIQNNVALGESYISEDTYRDLIRFAVTNGDLLMSCSGTIGKIVEVTEPYEKGIINQALLIMRINGSVVNKAFFKHIFRSEDVQKQIKDNTQGGAMQNLVATDIFKSVSFTVPSYEEQQKIANFLDHETAKIDTLIDKQEKLIELLKEKRQAVISHAVTKGLNPDAPMKDSGVEWLEEVPEHWVVCRLKHIKGKDKGSFVDGPFGSNLKSEHFINNGDVYVIESNFATTGSLDISKLKTISTSHFETISRSETKEGAIIIAKIGARYGMSSVLPQLPKRAVVSGNSLSLKVDEEKMDVQYSHQLLSHLKQEGAMDDGVNVTAQPALSLGQLNNLPFLCPPKEEQNDIVSFIQHQNESFSALIESATKMIELSKERKTALISAAVTGKIDVRDWQEPTYQESA
ncbi:hypothetical protein B7489_04310 [Vibrio alginolyticus]|uniref:restriction endonuclease subunit S n=1 Tax=Vibrio alginolyticus TaxID=663 RepID=UPI000A1F31AA|nr:restriction endonuclease subunit S [Vibrio alginolyticus]OSP15945.1 hypothetical protein B7489_04310 [Vibrio alginolyticus]